MQIVWMTICMIFQVLFSRENKENIIKLLSAELVQRQAYAGDECWDQPRNFFFGL